jgi:hypothetical protein
MMERMFDTDDHTPEFWADEQPTDAEVDLAVARLVAAFGGGELTAPRRHDRHPLTAA